MAAAGGGETVNDQTPPNREETELAELFERSGPRPAVSPDDLAAVSAAFRSEWQRHVAARRRAVSTRRFVLAATLVLGLGVAWWWIRGARPTAHTVRLAQVEALHGVASTPNGAVVIGHDLVAGTRVETGRGRGDHLALRTSEGHFLRLDASTLVVLEAADAIRLERGAVYVDSGPGATPITVSTPLGVARDIGTRFEVRLLDDGTPRLRVRVRDGAVELAGTAGSASATAGVELTLGDDGRFDRQPCLAHGEEWAWVVAAAPRFEIEGRSLAEFLAWVEHETGWRVAYEDPDLTTAATTIRLHGTLRDLNATVAPEVVLPGAAIGHRLEDGVLHVFRAR